MEVPLNNIKEQYNTEKQTQPTMTEADLKKARVEQEKYLDETLPFLRKQEEYNKLKASLLELDVLTGVISVKQVPGLLGLELMVREIQAQGYLTQWAAGQKQAIENQKNQPAMTEGDVADAEKKSKEQWDTMSQEDQERLMSETAETMKGRGIEGAWIALTEIQKINVIMQTEAMKANQ